MQKLSQLFNHSISQIIAKLALAYAIVFAIYNIGNFDTSDIVLGVLFVLVYALLNRVNIIDIQTDALQKKTSRIIAIIWTISYWIYSGESLKNELENKAFALFYIVLSLIGIFFIFYIGISFVLVRMTSISEEHIEADSEDGAACENHFSIKQWLHFSGIILLLLLPLFILNFPATMTVDSFDQLSQVRWLEPYSDHHPWIHTMVIKVFYSIGYGVTGSVTAGIATYTFAQMIIMALSVGYVIATLAELRFSRRTQIFVLLGYVIFPYNLAYAITMWKDVLFSAATLIFGITIYRMFVCKIPSNIRDDVLFVVSGFGMCLLRHNGFYAYMLSAVLFMIALFREHKKGFKIAAVCVSVIILSFVIKGPVQDAYGVTPGDYGHNLAIPLQQIGRTVAYNGDVSDKQYAALEKINSMEYIRNNYIPGGADNMIQWLVAGDSEYMQRHKAEFFGVWISLGIKNPITYCEAFIDQTKGYYTTMKAEQIAYYGVMPNHDNIDPHPLAGARVRIKINELCSKIQDVLPVYGIFYSVGACVMLMVLGIGILVCRGQKTKLYVYIPYIAIMLSVIIATPLVADLRYGYSLMIAMPMLITITVSKKG